MVDFGGWEMPQQYSSIRDEHFAVRRVAGLFDVSHMGRFRIAGDASLDFLQRLVTNDLGPLVHGQAQYSLLCNESGGIIDDLVVYRGSEGFFVVVNASNREHDLDWFRQHAPSGVEIEDRTFELSLLAFQGPRAEELLPAEGLQELPYFGFRGGDVAGIHALISRTGYTGEDGFELFVSADRVGEVWDAVLQRGKAAGVLPAGLDGTGDGGQLPERRYRAAHSHGGVPRPEPAHVAGLCDRRRGRRDGRRAPSRRRFESRPRSRPSGASAHASWRSLPTSSPSQAPIRASFVNASSRCSRA